ncbi:MAG: rhodanese-like domain-containing protein [Labrys sp. (in: a-proteobacteria)]|jgi:rhodanese-related sulfurtransferase
MPTADGPFFALDAAEAQAMLSAGSIVIVDVREAHEFAAGHIPGSINMPLSRFDPSDLPVDQGKRVVLSCAAGMRSFRALEMTAEAGVPVDTHLKPGFKGWISAGLPYDQGF